jgi:polar amino acid transport system substrate-binding protein
MRSAILKLALLFLAAAVTAACGSEDERSRSSPPEQVNATARPDVLARIMERELLIVGVPEDMPPFGFRDGRGNLVGFEVDLAEALAASLEVGAMPRPLPAGALRAVTAGEVDLAGAVAHTFAREESVDFSLPTFMDGQKWLTRKGSGLDEPEDLDGVKVAAVKGAGHARRLKSLRPETVIVPEDGYLDAFLDLKRGKARALTADATVLLRLRDEDAEPGMWTVAGPFLSSEPLAYALMEDQSDLRDTVNKALAAMWLSGDYQRIYGKWFGPESGHPLPLDFEIPVWPGRRRGAEPRTE